MTMALAVDETARRSVDNKTRVMCDVWKGDQRLNQGVSRSGVDLLASSLISAKALLQCTCVQLE